MVAALLGMYLVIGAAAQIVCNLIGFAYPAYASVKVSEYYGCPLLPHLRTFSALQAVRSKQTDDDTQWLVYWCVFAIFSFMDFFASSIMQWFPLYWLIKVSISVQLRYFKL